MGAFQTGFQIGSSAAQAALDRREREDKLKREEEERKLRLRQLELGIAEAERRAENNRRADLKIRNIRVAQTDLLVDVQVCYDFIGTGHIEQNQGKLVCPPRDASTASCCA